MIPRWSTLNGRYSAKKARQRSLRWSLPIRAGSISAKPARTGWRCWRSEQKNRRIRTWRIWTVYDLFLIPTRLVDAFQHGPLFFGGFLHQEGGAALGAGFGYGLIPQGIGTVRKPAATVKNLAALGFSFHQLPVAAFLRTFDARGRRVFHIAVKGSGAFAFRISAAREKIPVFALLDHHRTAAFVADFSFRGAVIGLHGVNAALLIPGVVPGIGAFGIAFAGQERSVFAHFDAQALSADGA